VRKSNSVFRRRFFLPANSPPCPSRLIPRHRLPRRRRRFPPASNSPRAGVGRKWAKSPRPRRRMSGRWRSRDLLRSRLRSRSTNSSTLPQVERSDRHSLRHALVEARAELRGVRLANLLKLAAPTRRRQFVSFKAHSTRRHDTSLPLADALQLETLLVWEVDGQPLAPSTTADR
jgi:hypothetical protein